MKLRMTGVRNNRWFASVSMGRSAIASRCPVFVWAGLLSLQIGQVTALAQNSFMLSGNLNNPRVVHTATLLKDGRVLIAGGGTGPDWLDGYFMTPQAELFDPATGAFSPAGTFPYIYKTATLLQSGQVLFTGGESNDGSTISSAELYDPVTGTFSDISSMSARRESHAATPLQDGRVLITGGTISLGVWPFWQSLTDAEIYDPLAGTFTPTGSMNVPRYGHTATLLADGRVLIAGGFNTFAERVESSAELFDPATGTFTPTGSMTSPRAFPVDIRLLDGRVLITQGIFADLYDPATGLFQNAGQMIAPRIWHTANLLKDGTVLIAGGIAAGFGLGAGVKISEIYDPVAGAFTRAADMNFPRLLHTATTLQDGSVAIIGGGEITDGIGFDSFPSAAEIYGPPRATISAAPNPCVLSGGLCTTYLNWSSGGAAHTQVWGKINNGIEVLYSDGASCGGQDCAAWWIQGGLTYTFALYDCDRALCTTTDHTNAQLIGSVQVTAINTGTMLAIPSSVH